MLSLRVGTFKYKEHLPPTAQGCWFPALNFDEKGFQRKLIFADDRTPPELTCETIVPSFRAPVRSGHPNDDASLRTPAKAAHFESSQSQYSRGPLSARKGASQSIGSRGAERWRAPLVIWLRVTGKNEKGEAKCPPFLEAIGRNQDFLLE